MIEQKSSEVQASYDRVANEYARHLYDESRHKPLDRQLLDRFVNSVRSLGVVCDLGCGPGQVARYLHERGGAVCVVDLSTGMIAQARELNPGIEFSQGDMRSLDVRDDSWAGIAAFYAIVNLEPADVTQALREMWLGLRAPRLLLFRFPICTESEHGGDLLGCAVCLDFYFFSVLKM